MSRDKDQWVIPANSGIKDYAGLPRATAVRIANGEVLLYVSAAGSDAFSDASMCVRMPNDIAEQLGYHLLSAAETNRLQEGRDR